MHRRKDRGFTLIETLLAVMVTAVAVTAILALGATGSAALTGAEHYATAASLAQGALETLKAMPYEHLSSAGPVRLSPPYDAYFRTVEVVSRAVYLKEVTVTVEWEERGQRRNVCLTTLRAARE